MCVVAKLGLSCLHIHGSSLVYILRFSLLIKQIIAIMKAQGPKNSLVKAKNNRSNIQGLCIDQPILIIRWHLELLYS